MDNVEIRKSDKHEVTDAQGVLEKDEERQALLDSVTKSEHMKSKPSLSSISSDFSSEDDFFQLDAATLRKPISNEQNSLSAGLLEVLYATKSTPPIAAGSQIPSEVDLSSGDGAAGDGNPSPEAETGDAGSSTPLVGNRTPQGQEAEKVEGYDPNRIPASVFEAKSLSPMDWSVASNESLFSIRMESYSFSRDHGLMIARSGELGNFSYSPAETDATDSPLPLSLGPEELNMNAGNDLGQVAATEAVNAQTMKDVLRAAAGANDGMYLPSAGDISSSASLPRHSDASSIHSFAFPILTAASMSLRVVPEQQSQWQRHPEMEAMETPRGVSKPLHHKWFHCFSCSLCHAD